MSVRTKELFKTTGIFAIGNLGSKVLSFLIVPFYTYVLTISEYGRIDLIATLISFLLPLTTLLVHEAAIRFVPTNEIDKQQAVTNCFVVFIIGSLGFLLLLPFINIFFDMSGLNEIFILVVVLYSFNDIFGNYLKAIGKTIIYSIYGVTNTFAFLIGNIFLVLVLKQGIYGYYLSTLIAQAISAVIVAYGANVLGDINFRCISPEVLKRMLRYSFPLIPNSLLWWVMTGGDKYIIYFFLGDSSNGIYSLSLKLPTILSVVFGIFSSAWQLSAIKESKADDRSIFYSKVYNYLWIILALGSSLLILIVWPLYKYVLSYNYYDGWKYVGLLIMATMVSCLGTFLGTVYVVTQKTEWSFLSTLLGAITNLVVNFLLVKPLGLFGIATGTICGYAVVLFIRSFHAQKFLEMDLKLKQSLVLAMLIGIQCIISICVESIWGSVIQILFTSLICIVCRNELFRIIERVFVKLSR
ncbi:lipopolysaccharide biosynthesis protein [Pseudobutyrivibrio xylanivorans]|uniref:Membrane protein involved in the export of O-antigen and teichoic acid n=1 Tax=Pseudobutyrivibrio xylanivorans DSM 14809 TaxID=1123012 RepID=A0A1M6KMZ6_PSEXY|nr:oligosaccharide flippase family protein [Pseudobutyrivibrio xylanivorans]SHJ60388.1 Membrane protein involved in the export of O-antigen and teichoic acid [Pseudobutyrivibrio xylanivorans DSM 14809]